MDKKQLLLIGAIGAFLGGVTACEKQTRDPVDNKTTEQSSEIGLADQLIDQLIKEWKEIQTNTTIKISKISDKKYKLEVVAFITERNEITIEEIKAQLKRLGFKIID